MIHQFSDFLSKADPVTLIVYGLVTEPVRVLAELERRADGLAPLANNYALLSKLVDELRFSSFGWIDITFEQRMALNNSNDLFQLCRRKLLRSVSNFSNPTRQFIDGYLDFVLAQTKAFKDELEEYGSGGEVYGAVDWVFSAWLPLPHAHILLPPEFGHNPPQFAEVDVAFWHDGCLKAVVIEDSSTPIQSKQRRLDYLLDNHPFLDLVSIPKNRIAEGHFPEDAFPATFSRYWEGLALPTGPAPPII